MIKKVLQAIVSEKILNKAQIAQKVGMQVDTIDDIIRLLIERGYLRKEVDGCDVESACSACRSAKSCDLITKIGQVFYVTERGKAYASMNGGGNE